MHESNVSPRIMKVASFIVSPPVDTSFYASMLPCGLFRALSPIATVDGGAFPACVRVYGGGIICAVPGC